MWETAHYALGLMLSRTGRPAEAEAEYREALPIIQKLADDNPTNPVFAPTSRLSTHNLGAAVHSLSRAAEARDCYDRAIVVIEPLVQKSPTDTMFRAHLARNLRHRGLARGDVGDARRSSGRIQRARWACTRGCPLGRASIRVETACCHAAICGLSGHVGAAVSVAEGEPRGREGN